MRHHFCAAFFLLTLLLSRPGLAQQKLGVFDGDQDVGAPARAGAAAYLPATQQYVVTGAGTNVWGDHDELHYLYKKVTGDFILYARASFVGCQGVEAHRKLGWMVRQSLTAAAPHVSAEVHGDGLTSLQYRPAAGAATEEVKAEITHADMVQLERQGDVYTMRVARFGQPFEVVRQTVAGLGDAVYVGLFVCSHNPAVRETAVFQDVRLSAPAPAGLVPYRQYLGSRLEVLDVATGSREVVYSAPNSLQAPNWQRDGKTLIYNSDGLMYSFDLATRTPTVLPTGDVKNNNNDHVLSFDGRQLGLSSELAKFGGSVVYTVPATGGTPRQITPRGPSYLHGWSPDGRSLVFTGQRKGDFDIYRVPANGGREVRLTATPGLDDGPEYTPDGQHIYFNSVRTGTMQIWRMRPDGSQPEAVTHGEFNDWFPHVSPDGKYLVFVSFLKEETAPGDHPFYQHVYLRRMPIGGGEPEVIAYVYGGQGTMNTPSWSPDGSKIAFISNTAAPY